MNEKRVSPFSCVPFFELLPFGNFCRGVFVNRRLGTEKKEIGKPPSCVFAKSILILLIPFLRFDGFHLAEVAGPGFFPPPAPADYAGPGWAPHLRARSEPPRRPPCREPPCRGPAHPPKTRHREKERTKKGNRYHAAVLVRHLAAASTRPPHPVAWPHHAHRARRLRRTWSVMPHRACLGCPSDCHRRRRPKSTHKNRHRGKKKGEEQKSGKKGGPMATCPGVLTPHRAKTNTASPSPAAPGAATLPSSPLHSRVPFYKYACCTAWPPTRRRPSRPAAGPPIGAAPGACRARSPPTVAVPPLAARMPCPPPPYGGSRG